MKFAYFVNIQDLVVCFQWIFSTIFFLKQQHLANKLQNHGYTDEVADWTVSRN